MGHISCLFVYQLILDCILDVVRETLWGLCILFHAAEGCEFFCVAGSSWRTLTPHHVFPVLLCSWRLPTRVCVRVSLRCGQGLMQRFYSRRSLWLCPNGHLSLSTSSVRTSGIVGFLCAWHGQGNCPVPFLSSGCPAFCTISLLIDALSGLWVVSYVLSSLSSCYPLGGLA